MNRELAIGLIFLLLLAAITLTGLALAWRIQHKRPADNLNDDEAADARQARLFRDLDTYAIPRSTVYSVVGEPVGGVEPELARAESWPLRQRH